MRQADVSEEDAEIELYGSWELGWSILNSWERGRMRRRRVTLNQMCFFSRV